VRVRNVALWLIVLSFPLTAQQLELARPVPTPAAHFGFRMGADRQLAGADDIERYFQRVAEQSDRVELVDLGPTTEGHRTIAAIVSAPDNIRDLERIREVNERLADPRTLPPDDARRVAATHKLVLVIGCSMHATEVGASQAANELLYDLATATDRVTVDELQNVIVIVVPLLNPDGYRRVVDWYTAQKGTPREGGPMPWGDHKYAGHDINRDAFMMNMAENRNLARFFYTRWHPQVFLSMHQMETDGARFFAPPNDDPINTNYDPMIWREAGLLGSAMTLELEHDGHTGVVSNALYDYYWPGYEDSAPLGHNTVCLLTEAARVNVATPIVVSADELRGGQKGLADYKPRINFPHPWPGGRWTLRDIVEYDLSAVRGLLRAAAAYRRTLIENFYEMGRRQVELGAAGGPFAFVIPSHQHDPTASAKLERLLLDGGIEVHRAIEPFNVDGMPYAVGTDIILMAQPYRAYVKTLLERQAYPAPARGESPDRSADRPYDVTGWTLPAQMGVDVRTIERPFELPATSRVMSASIDSERVWGDRSPAFYIVDSRGSGGAIAINRLLDVAPKIAWLTTAVDVDGYHYPAGSIVVSSSKAVRPVVVRIAAELGLRADGIKRTRSDATSALRRARVALYKPWMESTDEGWTRWVLERYEFPYATLSDTEVRGGDLRKHYDAVILPSLPPGLLTNGQSAAIVPKEYSGGLGDEGVQALVAFVQSGGTLICLDEAGGLAIRAFNLPVRDDAKESRETVFCPGSIVRIEVDPQQPLAYGMQPHTAGFFSFSAAYAPLAYAPGITAVARYADEHVLLSGWLEGESVIAGRAAAVQMNVGSGRVVLLGFRVQHRGQSFATFRLLFNSIFTSR